MNLPHRVVASIIRTVSSTLVVTPKCIEMWDPSAYTCNRYRRQS